MLSMMTLTPALTSNSKKDRTPHGLKIPKTSQRAATASLRDGACRRAGPHARADALLRPASPAKPSPSSRGLNHGWLRYRFALEVRSDSSSARLIFGPANRRPPNIPSSLPSAQSFEANSIAGEFAPIRAHSRAKFLPGCSLDPLPFSWCSFFAARPRRPHPPFRSTITPSARRSTRTP